MSRSGIDTFFSSKAWRYLVWAMLLEVAIVVPGWIYYLHAHPRTSDVFAVLALGLLTFGIALQFYNLGRTRDVEAERIDALKQQAQLSSPTLAIPIEERDDPLSTGASDEGGPQSQVVPAVPAAAGTVLRPAYAYLLALALFSLAVALHAPPTQTSMSRTDITLTPSPLPPTPTPSPLPSGASPTPSNSPSPTPSPGPMTCHALLEGPDTLTPGGASAYDVTVKCPQPAATAPDIVLSAAWANPTPTPNYNAVSTDGGRNFSWRFIATISQNASSAPAAGNDVHTILFSTIKVNPSKVDEPAPYLSVTIRQDQTLDNLKTIITTAGGVISALLALITGLWAFLKGAGPPKF